MTEYKKGDKVVVEIDEADAFELNNERDMEPDYEQVLGKLEDFQPVEDKIKFTIEEKREFDELHAKLFSCGSGNIYKTMNTLVNSDSYPELNKRVAGSFYEQMDLLNCLRSPSLVEVVEPEKRVIVLDNGLWLQRNTDGFFYINNDDDFDVNFTLDEIKQAEKQLGVQDLQAKWHESLKEKKMKFDEIITMLEIILPNEHEAYEIGRMAVYAESLRLPCKSMSIDDVEIVEKGWGGNTTTLYHSIGDVVEQFTGLKDKNGKEIFEGSLVKYTDEDGESFVAEVKYFAKDGYPAFDVETPNEFDFESNVLSAGVANNRLEVVGDIHNNHDLLEVEK